MLEGEASASIRDVVDGALSTVKVPIETGAARIERWLTDEGKREVTPAELLEAARPVDSVLHDLFEWDDAIAAESYRLTQARGWIRQIKIVVEIPEPVEFRAYVSVEREERRVYVKREQAKNERALRVQLIQLAASELLQWVDRYADFEELGEVVQDVKDVARRVMVHAKSE